MLLISLIKTSSKRKYFHNIIRRKKLQDYMRAQRLCFEPKIWDMM